MKTIKLPAPKYDGTVSVERALLSRRSQRDYRPEAVTLEETATLLWAAQGTTALGGFRTTPSAGALYPLEVYLVAGNVDKLPVGIYRYHSKDHALQLLDPRDVRGDLSVASLKQGWMKSAALMLVFTAVAERTTAKYGATGTAYVHMEAGHASENVYLEAVSLNLGTCAVGAMDAERVKKIMKLGDGEEPLYIMPVGRL